MNRLDLHGQLVNEAKESVNIFIQDSINNKIRKVDIITGKGNHLNQNGLRRPIYRKFIFWLNSNESFKENIKYVVRRDGSYSVYFEQRSGLGQTRSPHVDSRRAIISMGETELMKIIRGRETTEQKIEQMKALLQADQSLLHKTDLKGNTALIVAASENKIELMDFLLDYERKNNLPVKLLKQSNRDGSTPLIAAVEKGQFESSRYLLKKAPSLLKMRRHDGDSVFQVAIKSDNSKALIPYLCHELRYHKREKGYTGLFPELKKQQELLDSEGKTNAPKKIIVLDGRRSNVQKSRKSGLYVDRMVSFVNKIRKSFGKLNSAITHFPRALHEVTSAVIMPIFKPVLSQDGQFRRLFLRFNNQQKPRFERRFKHAINLYPKEYFRKIKVSRGEPLRKVKKNPQASLSTTKNILQDRRVTNVTPIVQSKVGKKHVEQKEVNCKTEQHSCANVIKAKSQGNASSSSMALFSTRISDSDSKEIKDKRGEKFGKRKRRMQLR